MIFRMPNELLYQLKEKQAEIDESVRPSCVYPCMYILALRMLSEDS